MRASDTTYISPAHDVLPVQFSIMIWYLIFEPIIILFENKPDLFLTKKIHKVYGRIKVVSHAVRRCYSCIQWCSVLGYAWQAGTCLLHAHTSCILQSVVSAMRAPMSGINKSTPPHKAPSMPK